MVHNNINFVIRKNDVNTFLHTVATVCLNYNKSNMQVLNAKWCT